MAVARQFQQPQVDGECKSPEDSLEEFAPASFDRGISIEAGFDEPVNPNLLPPVETGGWSSQPESPARRRGGKGRIAHRSAPVGNRKISGGQAKNAVAELIFELCTQDPVIGGYHDPSASDDVLDSVQGLLNLVYGGRAENWPPMVARPTLMVNLKAEYFCEAILDVLENRKKRSVNCKDRLSFAIRLVTRRARKDTRVIKFLRHIEEQAIKDETDEDSGSTINGDSLGEIDLNAEAVRRLRASWQEFCDIANYQDAKSGAANRVYYIITSAFPKIHAFRKSPRALLADRILAGIHLLVDAAADPKRLKNIVEMLGFRHMSFDITVPRVVAFRDAMLEAFHMDLSFGSCDDVWREFLDYVGGGLAFVRKRYGASIRLVTNSWKEALAAEHAEHDLNVAGASSNIAFGDFSVPHSFRGMITFNVTLSGTDFGTWIDEVIECFGDLAQSAEDSFRHREACEVMALRASNAASGGNVDLGKFKAVMLATLRILLPATWNPAHELAWSWFWDRTADLAQQILSTAPKWGPACSKLFAETDEKQLSEVRLSIFNLFFELASNGQNYFKQSSSRLQFIMDKVLVMSVAYIQDPAKLSMEINSLGLRHVGYGVPLELFSPFVTAIIERLSNVFEDHVVALEGLAWSLGQLSKILVRTVSEGSTIVMKAVNKNSAVLLKRAVATAPRGERTAWVLDIRVGIERISPLEWAIESGGLDAASAIIEDLLTIRADRERYYYGIEDLFGRHPDIIQRLCFAPSLLPILFKGMVWRSARTHDGLRRVNYYVKYMLVDSKWGVSKALHWLAATKDVKIISDPAIVLASNVFWRGLVKRSLMISKIWFVFALIVFMTSQAIIPKMILEKGGAANMPRTLYTRWALLGSRILMYCGILFIALVKHGRRCMKAFSRGLLVKVGCLPTPKYLFEKVELGSFLVCVCMLPMLILEPLLWCYGDPEWPTEVCSKVSNSMNHYTAFAAMAMFLLWLLLCDMAIFVTKLAAFVLVCGYVLREFRNFLVAFMFLLLTFGSAISVLATTHAEFRNMPQSMLALIGMTLGMYEKDYREVVDEPMLLGAIFVFIMASSILLMNLLIAQLTSSYNFVYADMVGFARMQRASRIVEVLDHTKLPQWRQFISRLDLDKNLEFEVGDIGIPGGISTYEAASANPVLTDMIVRFGGATEPELPWPEEVREEDVDRYEKVEELLKEWSRRLKVGGVAALKRRRIDGAGSSGSSLASSLSSCGSMLSEEDETISASR
eukprot:TRINITY_DN54783_c0_g1_i1.p1 TRINITY_DN54783_c0_g1~~TRINITY_DN54783_c0_g1_i1.p1  ORF type:complete len:1244 (-),score=197.29 TRINITY_DN54783_c0_g1_i1:31-3762(-)